MGEFFRGWRRKIRLLTLGLAVVFMAGWVRSRVVQDIFAIQFKPIRYEIRSKEGILALTRCKSHQGCWVWRDSLFFYRCFLVNEGFGVSSHDEFLMESKFRFCGVHFEIGHDVIYHSRHRLWPGAVLPSPKVIGDVVGISVHYWLTVIPLTALSAFLLLSMPRKSIPMKITEPIPEKEA